VPTKIGLISDTHSTTAPLEEALAIFKREQVDTIICAGDIAGYGRDELLPTIDLLVNNNCQAISGNHDYCSPDYSYHGEKEKIEAFFNELPITLNLTIEDKRIYVVHAQPPDMMHGGIKLLDPDGKIFPDRKEKWTEELKSLDCDILIVGHTHQVFSEQLGDILVINPGSTTFNHTCAILTLPEMKVDFFALSKKEPITVWNWAHFFRDQGEIQNADT
jgi:putative phosphoesterase